MGPLYITYGCFTPVINFVRPFIRVISYFPPSITGFLADLVSKIAPQKGAKILENGALFSCCSTQPQWQMKVQVWDPILKIYLEPETSTSKLVVSNWMMNQVFYHGKMVVSTKHPVNTMVVWSSRPLSCSQFFYSGVESGYLEG